MNSSEELKNMQKFMSFLSDKVNEGQKEFNIRDIDKLLLMNNVWGNEFKNYLIKNVVGYRELAVALNKKVEWLTKEVNRLKDGNTDKK